MDRTRWVGIGVAAFVAVMLGTTWFVVNGRDDGAARAASPLVPPSDQATASAVEESQRTALPAPTWSGEADSEPASPTGLSSEAANSEAATERDVPSGSEEPPTLEPVPVEPPASGVQGDYTDDEYRAIYEELNRRSVQLGLAPDPEQIDLFFSERCVCYSDYQTDLREGQQSGVTTTTGPAFVLAFDVIVVEDDGSFIARVVDQQQPGRAVDAEGNVVSESGVGKPFESNIRLSPEDGRWKVSQIEYVSEGSPNDPPPAAGTQG